MKALLRYLIVVLVGFALIIGLSLLAGYSGYEPSTFVYYFVIACIFGICKFLNDILKKKIDNNKKGKD